MDRIVRDPAVRGGRPAVRGTRVTVGDILAEIARGASVPQLLRMFPLIGSDDVKAALHYAGDLAESGAHSGPTLSIVVVVYDMPEQAKRTLYSLSTDYQRDVAREDYEVIVVENASKRMLGKEAALSNRMDTRYFSLDDGAQSPVPAANLGASKAKGSFVALMIDGARMVTPTIVKTALSALRAAEEVVVSVPGYHLGSEPQQWATDRGYDERVEAGLLQSVDWPSDGNRLFDIACLSGSCKGGLLAPFAESNFLCVSKKLFSKIGGYDVRFDAPGGGLCNLDLYKRICDRSEVTLFVTPAEGTFHQFHGGVTTGGRRADARERMLAECHEQYAALRGSRYKVPTREAALFGPVPRNVRRFLQPAPSQADRARTGSSPSLPAIK